MRARPQAVLASLLIIALPGPGHAQSRPLWDKLPAGPFAVGFRSCWQLDYSRRYNMTFDDKTTYAPGKAPRPILVNAWYPADKAHDARRIPHRDYLKIESEDPLLARFATRLAEYNRGVIAKEVMQKSMREMTDPEKRLLDQFLDTPTACIRDALPAKGRFPLVIYHSGHGSSFEDNSVLCEFLASHGFIVLGSAFQKPGGESFGVDGGHTSARDMEFLIATARQIPGVDWNHVGVIGHSGGAHAALRFGSLADAAVEAVVSLDTTQDYHALTDPGWEEMTTLVVKNRKNFRCPLLMVAGPSAFFELADTLQHTRRYYLTIKDMDHDDYIAQGGISRERLYQLHLGDAKQTEKARAEEKTRLARVKAGYQGLCEYILHFLEAELKGDPAGKGVLAKKYRDTPLGGDEPHVEFVPAGRDGPDPFTEDSTVPPTPRQLHRFLREHGSGKTIAVLKRFRKDAPAAPIYYPIFELYLVCDLLDAGKARDAIAFSDYYRETGLDCAKLLSQAAKGFQSTGATKLAETYHKRLLLLNPTSRPGADERKQPRDEKKDR
jgi:pimeloyl-ACP methyl ester carboxylesterase